MVVGVTSLMARCVYSVDDELSVYRVPATAPHPALIDLLPATRPCQSLGLLCGRFVEVYGRSQHFRDKVSGEGGGANSSSDGPEGMVELDRAAGELGVARRRIYDVINILESVCVVTRARKNTYRYRRGEGGRGGWRETSCCWRWIGWVGPWREYLQ